MISPDHIFSHPFICSGRVGPGLSYQNIFFTIPLIAECSVRIKLQRRDHIITIVFILDLAELQNHPLTVNFRLRVVDVSEYSRNRLRVFPAREKVIMLSNKFHKQKSVFPAREKVII